VRSHVIVAQTQASLLKMNFRKRDYLHDRPSSIGNISGVINNNPNLLTVDNYSN
jgi:hypothetical protein